MDGEPRVPSGDKLVPLNRGAIPQPEISTSEPSAPRGNLNRLIRLSRDYARDPDVRKDALRKLALVNVGQAEAAEIIVGATLDPNVEVKIEALRATSHLMERVAENEEALRDEHLASQWRDVIPKIEPALVSSSTNRDPDVRREAFMAIGHLESSDERVVKAVTSGLRDEDRQTRQAAAWAAGKIGVNDPDLRSTLTEVLDDPNPAVRRSASEAIVQISNRNDSEEILGLIRHSEGAIARGAIGVLGRELLEDQNIYQQVKDFALTNSPVQGQALYALKRAGLLTEDVIAYVKDMVNDPDESKRQLAEGVLSAPLVKS